MQFRPCIDLHDGKVKQIVGSSITNEHNDVIENFVSEHTSSYYAKQFQRDALTGGHVIMLGKGNEEAALEALAAYPNQLQIGGGITAHNAKSFIDAGASHVIVTSYIFHNGQFDENRLQALVETVGKEHIVLDLSCRKKDGKWFVMTDRWTTWSEFEVNEQSIRYLEAYCDEFLIHAVDVEGKKGGMALDLIEDLAQWVTIPTTYAGGVRSMEDLQLFEKMTNGALHITIGSALSIFGGDLSYDEVVAYCKKGNTHEYHL
jgi:phosphoribosylformimino-5-aminoimidazole carboxamide ribotide isomerase